MSYLILPIVALLTAALSAIIGMGGGMLLLATMFFFLSHAEAIPVHAAVQLISNSTRTVVFLRHVDWPTLGRFAIGLAPGSAVGVLILLVLGQPEESEPWLKLAVGAYILASLLIPTPRGSGKQPTDANALEQPDANTRGAWWDFPLLGLFAGSAAFTVGAVGPLIAPLFARRDFVKERLVATKAVCQTLTHVAKLPVFLVLRSYENLEMLGLVTVLMAVAVIPGTLLGKRVLRHVSEERFVLLFRIALSFAGLKVLLWDGVRPLLMRG